MKLFIKFIKGKVSRDFWTKFLFAEQIRPGLHMNRHKQFHELFRFRKDIRSQSSKITCLRRQQLRGHTFFANVFCENKKFLETVFACSHWVLVEFFFLPKKVKYLVTMSL